MFAARALRLEDGFVVFAGDACEGGALLFGCLNRSKPTRLRLGTLSHSLLDGIDATVQQSACLGGCLACLGDTDARGCDGAAFGGAKAHFSAPAIRGGEAEDPAGAFFSCAEKQAAAVLMVTWAGSPEPAAPKANASPIRSPFRSAAVPPKYCASERTMHVLSCTQWQYRKRKCPRQIKSLGALRCTVMHN
jgi:hypothetical protein